MGRSVELLVEDAMKIHCGAAAFLLCSMAACGEPVSNSSGGISWRFDYKNWKDTAAVEDPRGCDNQPVQGSGAGYSAITTVRMLIEDPEGKVPGMENDYPCADGAGDARVPLRGLAAHVFSLTLEAKNAEGRILYALPAEELDLAIFSEETFTVPTATGEIHFIPQYQGAGGYCPADLARVRYSVYRDEGADPVLTGIQAIPCESDGLGHELPTELSIREIPLVFEEESTTLWNPFRLVVEGLNTSDTVIFCVVNPSRNVRLGANADAWTSETLLPGACPG